MCQDLESTQFAVRKCCRSLRDVSRPWHAAACAHFFCTKPLPCGWRILHLHARYVMHSGPLLHRGYAWIVIARYHVDLLHVCTSLAVILARDKGSLCTISHTYANTSAHTCASTLARDKESLRAMSNACVHAVDVFALSLPTEEYNMSVAM